MKKPMPRPKPRALSKKVNAEPSSAQQRALFDQLAGQIQVLATRLEALRAQGAANTTEFKQVEALLTSVQDKLLLAQTRLPG